MSAMYLVMTFRGAHRMARLVPCAFFVAASIFFGTRIIWNRYERWQAHLWFPRECSHIHYYDLYGRATLIYTPPIFDRRILSQEAELWTQVNDPKTPLWMWDCYGSSIDAAARSVYAHDNYFSRANHYGFTARDRHSFHWPDDSTGHSVYEVAAPHWFLTALSLLLAWITGRPWRRYLRRRRRLAKGLCPACGYDLRATPDCCPECGEVNNSEKIATGRV